MKLRVTGLGETIDALDRAVSDHRDRLAASLLASLREATPVITGRARDGWRIDAAPGGNPVIRNPVPYVQRLNDGHASQAPAGFIERALDTALEES